MSKVVAFTDTAGDLGVIHVLAREAVLTLKDQSVTYDGAFVISTDNKSGEVTKINTANCTVENTVEDENAGVEAPVKRPAKKTELKVVGNKRSVRRGSDDDEQMD